MNVANANSCDLLAESQIWKSWKEVQVSICTRPTMVSFFSSHRESKVWKEICQTVNRGYL